MDDLEALRTLKARYFRHIDRKEWEQLRDVFVEDVAIDVSDDVGPRGVQRGRDQFVDRISKILAGVVTVHHGHMPELEITGPATARGIWAMEDRLEWPDGRVTTGAGHYEEEYTREGDIWRISRMRLARLRLSTEG